MGSAAMPIPGASNPTGAFDGTFNPNYAQETYKSNQNLYQLANPNNVPLGVKGPSVFSVPPSTPSFNPSAAPPVPQTWSPGMGITPTVNNIPSTPGFNGSGGSGLMFGYPTAPTGNFPMVGTASNGVQSALGLPVPGGGALTKQWGSMGNSINSFIKDGMGFNPKVASMMANDITPYFQANMNNLMEMFGSAGDRFSSDAALAGGQMTASFTAQQEQIFTQMYQQAVQNYMAVLTGGRYKEGGGGIMSSISSALGLAKAGGAGLEAAGVGAGGGTLGAIVGGLAAL
jgi:hypothetical protein